MSESNSLPELKQASQQASKRTLSMSVLMTPDMSNFSGNVHGGTILKFLDQVAYACASRYAQTYVVTLSVDRVGCSANRCMSANSSRSALPSITPGAPRWKSEFESKPKTFFSENLDTPIVAISRWWRWEATGNRLRYPNSGRPEQSPGSVSRPGVGVVNCAERTSFVNSPSGPQFGT